MSEIKHIDIAEFRRLGFVQEINRTLLHPHGLALEVTVMDSDKDDEKLVDLIASIIEEQLIQILPEPHKGNLHVREAARMVAAKLYPRGSERLSGVWDYRDDPEGICFGDGELDDESRVRALEMEEMWECRRAKREHALGYMIQPLPEPGREPLTVDEAMARLNIVDYDDGGGERPCVHNLRQVGAGPLLGAHMGADEARALIEKHGAEVAGPGASAMKHGVAVLEDKGATFLETKD